MTMGQVAYEAFCMHTQPRYTNTADWENITPESKKAWDAAAMAVVAKTGDILKAVLVESAINR